MKRAPLIGCGLLLLGGLVLAGETGFAEIVQGMLETMEKMSASLATIKDEPTAKAAVPELKKSAAQWKHLRTKASKMKPPSPEESDRLKKEYGHKLQAADRKLKSEIARVKTVPGGSVALKEIRLIVEKTN